MQRLFYYLLTDEETYGIGTLVDIAAISNEKNAPVWVQVLASHSDIENYICEGGTVEEGTYIVNDGVIDILGENDDYEIVHISNLRLVV